MDNTNDKPFLTYEQQIQKLIDKGLTIHDRKAATALLKSTVILHWFPAIKNLLKQKMGFINLIPLWVMMKALTLGTVSKFYSFLPQNIQSRVSIEFDYVTENELVRMLDLLARVRNVCAHNERLFNYRYNKGAINDTFIHQYLGISKINGQFSKGKQDSNSCKNRKCSNTWDFRTIGQALRMRLWVVAKPYSFIVFPQNIPSPEADP